MIEQNRDEFFAANDAKPCRHCLQRDEPGTGIGPVIASMLFESYANAEVERLDRLAERGAVTDDYDARLKRRNNDLYIRACWLSNTVPEAMPAEHLSQMLSRAA